MSLLTEDELQNIFGRLDDREESEQRSQVESQQTYSVPSQKKGFDIAERQLTDFSQKSTQI